MKIESRLHSFMEFKYVQQLPPVALHGCECWTRSPGVAYLVIIFARNMSRRMIGNPMTHISWVEWHCESVKVGGQIYHEKIGIENILVTCLKRIHRHSEWVATREDVNAICFMGAAMKHLCSQWRSNFQSRQMAFDAEHASAWKHGHSEGRPKRRYDDFYTWMYNGYWIEAVSS